MSRLLDGSNFFFQYKNVLLLMCLLVFGTALQSQAAKPLHYRPPPEHGAPVAPGVHGLACCWCSSASFGSACPSDAKLLSQREFFFIVFSCVFLHYVQLHSPDSAAFTCCACRHFTFMSEMPPLIHCSDMCSMDCDCIASPRVGAVCMRMKMARADDGVWAPHPIPTKGLWLSAPIHLCCCDLRICLPPVS